ncbi:MAG: SDR family NAD(P)-dependent oxidoreductase [Methyloceanibacter sp.]
MNEIDPRLDPPAPAAVITGATQGIGRALADEFAKGGHSLLLVARDAKLLARTTAEIGAAHGVEVKMVSADLATTQGCDAVEDALRRFGLYPEILVNNAAMMIAGFFQDQDSDKLRQLTDINVRAVVDLTRRFLPGMLARGCGGVLNVASVEGFMPVPYQATYAATKAFIISWSRALAYETMGTGVRISVVAPGPIETHMHAKAGAENSRYFQFLPVMTAEEMARVAYLRFKRGKWIILSGWFNWLVALGVRFVPGILLIPAVGWFFRVRDAEGNLQEPGPLPEIETNGGPAGAKTPAPRKAAPSPAPTRRAS